MWHMKATASNQSNDTEYETPPRHMEALANAIEIGILPVPLAVVDLPLSVAIIARPNIWSDRRWST